MHKKYYDLLIGFLTGAAWALVFILSINLFFTFLPNGLHIAIIAGLIGIVLGLFFVIFVETFSIQLEKLHELKKHTKLLEKLLEKLDD